KATLLALKDKGQKQEDGNTVDFLWNTYGKCHTDDRKNQKRSSDFFRNVMSCRIEVCEKARKNDNKNGI
ncbi:hypothetical protein, partial [Phocaeicola vulgatus]